jgi:hypothetical protein
MLFKLSCLLGIGLALADGSTTLFWAAAGLVVTIWDRALRAVLWFSVVLAGPWLLFSGRTVQAIVLWPYAAVYLGYSLLLDRVERQSVAYRYFSALGWATLAVQGWIVSGWLLHELTENPLIRGPVQYLIATVPAALAASFYTIKSLRPNVLAPRRTNRLGSGPAES